jgi:A/G-specific adenine glycosylase
MRSTGSNAWRRRFRSTSKAPELDSFANRLLGWFEANGRHDLPWQLDANAYRIWISEVMLQQTQVGTVVAYFERFIGRFPDMARLARASVDDVLALWSGLGYYARARNLHRAAQIVVERHAGVLPDRFEELIELPGIGRSTAGAILAQAYHQRQPILDGNVKRVIARFHAIEGWPNKTGVARELWRLADEHTPSESVAAYTQAIMDLGATVCTRGQPRCDACPVAGDCEAHRLGLERELPTSRPRPVRPARSVTVLVVQNAAGETLLERRPATGIWGGLLSFPELEAGDSEDEWCLRRLGARPSAKMPMPSIDHAFTHFDLTLLPVRLTLEGDESMAMDGDRWLWYNSSRPLPGGVATPIGKILQEVTQLESLH